MKRVSGIKDRDDRSIGIEIRMTDDFAKIKPTDPLRLAKQTVRVCKKNNRMKAPYIRPEVSTHSGRKTIGSGRFKYR